MARQRYKPLQIDIFLATDLVIQQPIHLDALLVYAQRVVDEDRGQVLEWIEDVDLPLRKVRIGQRWFWDCSDSIILEQKRSIDTIKKKFFLNHLKKRTVNIAGLQYGSHITTFERIQAERVRFFAYGDSILIDNLLSCIKSIGMMRNQGFGVIKDISISVVDMDFCCWDRQQHLLLRNIPIPGDILDYLMNPEVTVKYGRYRPPYYDRGVDEGIVPLFCVGSRFDLAPHLEVIS